MAEFPLRGAPLGYALMGLAGLISVIAMWLGWQTWNTWQAANTTARYLDARFRGDLDQQERLTRAVRASSANGVVLTLDPTASEASDDFASANRSLTSRHRRALDVTPAWIAVLAGDQTALASVDAGSNRSLLEHIAVLQQNPKTLPAWPAPGGEPPAAAIQLRAAEEHLRVAWLIGDAVAVRDASARLALLAPRHPAAGEAALIAGVLDQQLSERRWDELLTPVAKDRRQAVIGGAIGLASNQPRLLGDGDQTERLTQRRQMVARALSADQPTMPAADRLAIILSSDQPDPSALASTAAETNDPALIARAATYLVAVADRVLIADSAEARRRAEAILGQAKQLAGQADAAAGARVRAYAGLVTGDIGAAASLLGPDDPMVPSIWGLHATFDQLNFHLAWNSNALPVLPMPVLTLTIDGRVHELSNLGSLHSASITAGSRPLSVRLMAGDHVVFQGEVQR